MSVDSLLDKALDRDGSSDSSSSSSSSGGSESGDEMSVGGGVAAMGGGGAAAAAGMGADDHVRTPRQPRGPKVEVDDPRVVCRLYRDVREPSRLRVPRVEGASERVRWGDVQDRYGGLVVRLHGGDSFGARAVVEEGAPRSATVVAVSRVLLLSVEKDGFFASVGRHRELVSMAGATREAAEME